MRSSADLYAPGNHKPPGSLAGRFIAGSQAIGTAAMMLGAAVLLGWALDVPTLKNVVPGAATMKVNTALCFLLTGLPLAIGPTTVGKSPTLRLVGAISAGAVLVIALATLAEYALRVDLRIDELFVTDIESRTLGAPPGRPGVNTALAFAFLGVALGWQQAFPRQASWAPNALAGVPLLLSSLALVSYAIGVSTQSAPFGFATMALHTAGGLLLLSLAVPAARPDVAPGSILAQPSFSGRATRRMLPALAVFMLAVGWLRIEGQQAGFYGWEFGTALMVSSGIVGMVVLLLWFSHGLGRAEAERERLVADLRAATTRLDRLLGAEQAQRERSEQRFDRVFELAPHAMMIVDGRGRIRQVNAQLSAWFGYRTEELENQLVEVLIPERYRASHPRLREGYMMAPTVRPMGTGRDLFARRKDGSEFRVDISLSPVEGPGGPQVIASIVDITERIRIEEELRRANTALELANKELETFAYSASHDLRQPVRTMTGFTQILMEDFGPKLEPEALGYLRRIQQAGVRMGQLIDALLGLARIARSELRREPVDLTALAEDVAEELRRAQPQHPVQAAIAPGLAAQGDARLLRILLENLLGNAWKFTAKRPTPRVEVGAVAANGQPAFYVRDNGAGFDMAYADKLFGAFQRLHSPDEYPGTGIGLATAQRIVRRHGGRIWAEGAPGAGATFYFTL